MLLNLHCLPKAAIKLPSGTYSRSCSKLGAFGRLCCDSIENPFLFYIFSDVLKSFSNSPIAVATPHTLISGFRHVNGDSCRLRFFTSMLSTNGEAVYTNRNCQFQWLSCVTWCYHPHPLSAALRPTHHGCFRDFPIHSVLKLIFVNTFGLRCFQQTFSSIDNL